MSFPFKLPLLLDGAMDTNLYACGMPVDVRKLCKLYKPYTQKWMLNNSQAVTDLLQRFAAAGSDAVAFPAFLTDILGPARSKLANESAPGKMLIGGAVYPSDMPVEPYGETSFTELIDFYKQQCYALRDNGADFIVAENMSALADMRAAVIAARKASLPILVAAAVDELGRAAGDCPVLSMLITLQAMGVAAFGLSCMLGPDEMAPIIREIAPFARIPLIAKPNAGDPNPLLADVYELSPNKMAELFVPLLDAGVELFGGCCGTTPAHIEALNKLRNEYDFESARKMRSSEDCSLVLADETETYFLSADFTDISEPLECAVDMTDELLELNNSGCDVICVSVSTPDDAYQFSLNAHMAALPVMFASHNEIALKTALLLYQGRAMIDKNCDIDMDILANIAAKYGSVIY